MKVVFIAVVVIIVFYFMPKIVDTMCGWALWLVQDAEKRIGRKGRKS